MYGVRGAVHIPLGQGEEGGAYMHMCVYVRERERVRKDAMPISPCLQASQFRPARNRDISPYSSINMNYHKCRSTLTMFYAFPDSLQVAEV